MISVKHYATIFFYDKVLATTDDFYCKFNGCMDLFIYLRVEIKLQYWRERDFSK